MVDLKSRVEMTENRIYEINEFEVRSIEFSQSEQRENRDKNKQGPQQQ